ncbi:MAG: hypothetical protein RRA35_06035, partial [Desulfomonilia bacterium]|nr:hypothetical protein [Desulfomonilia bacterium]
CCSAQLDSSCRILNLDACAGEIVVSQSSLGASSFTGYYNLPEQSRAKLLSLDGEDFYRMGDLGAIVERDGVQYLVFLGRTGDWIRFKGENWAPVDAEKVIARFPGITNAGIIGVPQPIGREDDPMYIIEVSLPSEFDIHGFFCFCKENLPHYMMPRFIRVVKSLPMTDTMKLKKSVLKAEFYSRDPAADGCVDDIVYLVENQVPRHFTSTDYLIEIARFSDATNRDTLKAFTKRTDLFDDERRQHHE